MILRILIATCCTKTQGQGYTDGGCKTFKFAVYGPGKAPQNSTPFPASRSFQPPLLTDPLTLKALNAGNPAAAAASNPSTGSTRNPSASSSPAPATRPSLAHRSSSAIRMRRARWLTLRSRMPRTRNPSRSSTSRRIGPPSRTLRNVSETSRY